MRVLFRVDASLSIGGGHVMRCLALAHELARRGADVHFLSAVGARDVAPALAGSPFSHTELAEPQAMPPDNLRGADLMVVDHYQLDHAMERRLRPWGARLLVIDDLADRPHDCDILLDQTFGCRPSKYEGLVPAHCRILAGAEYALLRPEFAASRDHALARRSDGGPVRRLLISLGLTTPPETIEIALKGALAAETGAAIDLVIGGGGAQPWLDRLCRDHPSISVHGASESMAELMTQADLAIGAGGTTSWERCTLGLPTVVVVLAENQREIAAQLAMAGAVRLAGGGGGISVAGIAASVRMLAGSADERGCMSQSAAAICDGLGAPRAADIVAARDPV